MIFSRVKPKEISIEEKYKYRVKILAGKVEVEHSRDQQGYVEKPTGKIEIKIPYSGKKYFTKQAIEDIEKHDADIWKSRDKINAHIGYLVFSDYNDTDLDERLELDVSNDAIAIEIPILDDTIVNKEDLRDGRHECRRFQEYVPAWPENTPIDMNIDLFDDSIGDELRVARFERLTTNGESGGTDEYSSLKGIADILARKEGFHRGLGFGIVLTLILPGALEVRASTSPPKLSKMEIQWPVTTSHHQISIQIQNKEQEVHYIPDGQGHIKWSDISFREASQKREEENLDEYYTPPMILALKQPGELYDAESLKGVLEISVPVALSGLELYYFEANGKKSECKIKHSSKIQVEFEVDLSESFEERIYIPYQYLEFEGVILDQMRINDITNILQDLGFGKPEPQQLFSEESSLKRYLIQVQQTIGVEDLLLWLVITGNRTLTTREREIPGGKKFTTDIGTGHTTVYMRGWLKGDSIRLIEIMNEVQTKLKELFRHVVAID